MQHDVLNISWKMFKTSERIKVFHLLCNLFYEYRNLIIMKRLTFFFAMFLFVNNTFGQNKKTDANIVGHVVYGNEHIPFATVNIIGTTIGTTTDETGHYRLINLPVGTITIQAQFMGYKPQRKIVTISARETKEINFDLEPDQLKLDEVVVSGNRMQTNRKESPTLVNTISPDLFSSSQSITLSEGLNFSPGLRIENNCQNCGFNQVRMNGLEGPYSQILINGRPIFSGLAGVYGLEMIPSNMLERVEVTRGGGSTLYGSNAIAGTINLVLKDPVFDIYEFGLNGGLVGLGIDGSGNPAQDYSVNFNTSLVSENNKSGMSLYGFYRNRNPFDANNDSYSEIPYLNNVTIGTRLYHRFGRKSKLTADFFHINESRRGGDKFDYPPHEAGIAEAVKHNITSGALTFDQFVRKIDLLSVYVSGQGVNRNSYYGANQSLSDYGNTKDFSYNFGVQYNMFFRSSNLVLGIENRGSRLKDNKLGYPDIENAIIINDTIVRIPHTSNVLIANQSTNTTGVFSQYEVSWNQLKISAGARLDHYKVTDNAQQDTDISNTVFIPKISLLYDITKYLQARASYSQGYRAPQIFDEDLHIETSGSRQVIHRNDPDLKQESSYSILTSLDFNKKIGSTNAGLLVEYFYTKLNDAFVNLIGEPDSTGTVVYTRTNAESGAYVQGINLELTIVPNNYFSLQAGFTIQQSRYEEPQQFNESKFLRAPADYGYLAMNWEILKNLSFSATGNYTGKMLVPYFGTQQPDPDVGVLKESGRFFDLGIKVYYDIRLNGTTLQIFTGMKNIFNSYQNDFDTGIDRDPGYIYGPVNPRTFYFGIKFGNFLD